MSQSDNLIDLGAVVAQAVEDKTKELQKELAEAQAENAKLKSFVSQLKEMGQEYKDELAEAKAEVESLSEGRVNMDFTREDLNDMILKLVAMVDKMDEQNVDQSNFYIDLYEGCWGLEFSGKEEQQDER